LNLSAGIGCLAIGVEVSMNLSEILRSMRENGFFSSVGSASTSNHNNNKIEDPPPPDEAK
jgi:hypothetical protein